MYSLDDCIHRNVKKIVWASSDSSLYTYALFTCMQLLADTSGDVFFHQIFPALYYSFEFMAYIFLQSANQSLQYPDLAVLFQDQPPHTFHYFQEVLHELPAVLAAPLSLV